MLPRLDRARTPRILTTRRAIQATHSSCSLSLAMADLSAHVVTHVLDRVRSDLALLQSVGCLSPEDLAQIQAKLPTSVVVGDVQAQTAVAMAETPRYSPPPSAGLTRKTPPPPPARAPQPARAEAKWDYESGDPADLSFKQGDVIEILEETSPDWWNGRLNGREGMFPSNRCIKLEPAATTTSQSTGPGRYLSTHNSSSTFSSSTGVNKFGLKPASVDPEKKDKYGKLKSTMANSAAGGVGFGAGAAIGGGLIRAIF